MFEVGSKVYLRHSAYRASFTVYTVENVYKNGNFTLEGDKQQFRSCGRATGGGFKQVYPLTEEIHEELKAAVAAEKRQYDFAIAIDALDKLWRRVPISDDQLARIHALAAELGKPNADH